MSAPKSDLEWLIQLGREGNQPHIPLVERAAAELADYELRLDLLAKGATWEHEENERLKDEIAVLRAENERLTARVEAWQDAYFNLEWETITGDCLLGCGGDSVEGHADGCVFIANLPAALQAEESK